MIMASSWLFKCTRFVAMLVSGSSCRSGGGDRALYIFKSEVAQLFWIGGARRAANEIRSFLGFWKSDHVPNRRFIGEQGRHPIKAQGQPPVRRRAGFQRFNQKTKFILDLLCFQSEQTQNNSLDVGVMDTDTTTAEFGSVQNDVVSAGAKSSEHGIRICNLGQRIQFLQMFNVLGARRGKRMMDRHPPFFFVTPFEP